MNVTSVGIGIYFPQPRANLRKTARNGVRSSIPFQSPATAPQLSIHLFINMQEDYIRLLILGIREAPRLLGG